MEVDLVYSWVNSQDESWLRERHEHAAAETGTHREYRLGESRYRDRDELRHSIMTVRTFLPFIRTIYVVHAGYAPEWLKSLKGVVCVPDQEIVPADLFPTYQSDVIEAYIYRLPGLSEHYLYSNDDYFFSRPHTISDFFTAKGKCRVAITDRYASMSGLDAVYKHMEINAARALQNRIGLAPRLRVGRASLAEMVDTRLRAFKRGIKLINTTTHVTQPYLKSAWNSFSATFSEELAQISQSRFRSVNGMTVNLMYHHYLRRSGLAEFYSDPSHVYLDSREPAEKRQLVLESFRRGAPSMTRFCINDHAFHAEDPPEMGEAWSAYLEELKFAIREKSAQPKEQTEVLVELSGARLASSRRTRSHNAQSALTRAGQRTRDGWARGHVLAPRPN